MNLLGRDATLWKGGLNVGRKRPEPPPATDLPPVAGADMAMTVSGGTITIDALENDADPEGAALVITGASAASGSVEITPDGLLRYTAAASFTGTDLVTYTIADPAGNSAEGRVTVTVGVSDQPPVTGADTAIVASGGTVSIDVLANDTDPEGSALTVTAASAISGSVTVETDGTLIYTAPAGFSGTDTITYTVTDAAGSTSDGEVAVSVIVLAIQTEGSLGDFTVLAEDGDFILTVTEPVVFAGDYTVRTIDLQGGPLNLQLPSISGGQAVGDTLSATPGLWAYDEAHGPLSLTQQWYRGAIPVDGATGDSYTIQPEDSTVGLRFVRTATNAAGSRAIELEALPAAPSTFEEAGVAFDGRDTHLVRHADLAPDSKESVWFVSFTPKTLGRQSILRQATLHNGVQIWYDQFQLRLAIDGTDRNVTSRNLVAGKRVHALASVTDNNGFSRLSLWTRFEGEAAWTEEQTFSVAGGVADLSFGGFTVGARHTPTTSQNLDVVLFRLAVWAGSSYPEAIAQSARDALVGPDGTLNDPAAAYALFGTPRVDLYGRAADYAAGINHGSAGNFDTVNGVFTDA